MARTMRERIAKMVIDHPERLTDLNRARDKLANGEIRIEVVRMCDACGEGELSFCSEIRKLDYMGKTAYHVSCHNECDTCGAYLTDWDQSTYNLVQYQIAKEQVGMP